MQVDQDRINHNLQIWQQTMEATHDLILAGLRHKIGPDGDLREAYRLWYRHQRELAAQRLERESAIWLQRQAGDQASDTESSHPDS
ncbi:MAG: hypothetical protein R3C53_15740 [Pirellulaceae bacterium]